MKIFMTVKTFDNIIKNTIDNHSIEDKSRSWDRLEEVLDQTGKEDKYFDALISDKIKSHIIPTPGYAYQRFLKANPQPKYHNSYFNKWITTFAVFLLIMLFATLGYYQFSTDNTLREIKPEQKIANANSSQSEISEIKRNSYNKDNTAKSSVTFTNQFNEDLAINVDNIKYQIFENVLETSSNIREIESTKLSNNTQFKSRNNEYYGINLLVQNNIIQPVFETLDNGPANLTLKISSNRKESTTSTNIFNIKSISAYLSPGLSFISTPNDLIFSIPGYKQSVFSLPFGLRFNYQFGKNMVNAGLQYQSLNYTPQYHKVAINDKVYWMDKINFKYISLPVNYSRDVYKGKTTFYLTGGLDVSLIAGSDYNFVEYSTSSNELIIKLAHELLESSDFQQTLYASKKYQDGIADGGKIRSNLSLGMSVGFGMSYNINNKFSLFIEPSYHQNILNVKTGPNDDDIKGVYIKLGFQNNLSQ